MANKKSKRIHKNCPTCNKEFTHIPSRPQKYCSSGCYHSDPAIKEHRRQVWNHLFKKDRS